MDIKKILSLNEEETAKLVAAGGLLKQIAIAIENGTVDELDGDTKELIAALSTVIARIIK